MIRICSSLAACLLSAWVNSAAADCLLHAAQGEFDLANCWNRDTHASPESGPGEDAGEALLWASHYDRADIVKALLARGALPRANAFGTTPLHEAARNGSAPVIAALLAAGANPNELGAGKTSALMIAARTGTPGAVKALLDAGAEVNHVDIRKQSALMWAAAENHVDVLTLLLESGADPARHTDAGFNALLLAARAGHSAAVQRLLAAGVDVNTVVSEARPGRRAAPKGSSALILAIDNGHYALADTLLQAGADPNDLRSGKAALHWLVGVRKPDIGDGADLPPEGSGRMTSLDLATSLLAHNADPNLRIKTAPKAGGSAINLEGATPLLLAAKTADLPYIALLVEHGADPLARNIDEVTPLMMAAGLGTQAADEEAGTEEEALALVDYLLARGADINAVSRDGETAMHGAAYKNFPKVVHQLAEKGANIHIWNRKNKQGWTPLLIAQGFRPGNFKPSAKTEAAFAEVMLAQGLEVPPAPSRSRKKTYLDP